MDTYQRQASLLSPQSCGLGTGWQMRCFIIQDASMAHIGMQRDEVTHEPIFYYEKYPEDLASRQVILVDPMLATGGSAIEAARRLKEKGVSDILFTCLVAAPEGVSAFQATHPDIPIITAALDRG